MTRPRSSVPWLALLLLAVLGPSARADLFVACAGFSNVGVQEFDSTTGAFVRFFVPGGSNNGPPQPGALAFGPNGDLFLTDMSTSTVDEYNGRTGAFVRTFVPYGGGGLNSPADLTFGPNGDLFVSDHFKVLEYNGTTGAFVRTFVPYGGGGLLSPADLKFGPNGDLFVSDHFKVQEYDGVTGAFVKTFVPPGSGGLGNMVFGPNGDLFVSDSSAGTILEYNGKTGAFVSIFVTKGSGGLINPSGLAFGPHGELFVGSNGNTFPSADAAVLEYDGTTGAFVKTFVPFLGGGLIHPAGMALGPNGDLFVADALLGAVLEYDGTTGTFVTAFATGLASLPTDVTFGPSAAVPEPSSWLLLTGGGLLAGLGLAARRGFLSLLDRRPRR